MIDWGQTVITTGVVVICNVLGWVATEARRGQRLETVEKAQEVHNKRLNGHDEQFRELNTKFVPRVELSETLDSIRESQKRTERWLENLLFKPGGINGGPDEL